MSEKKEEKKESTKEIRETVAEILGPDIKQTISTLREELEPLRPQIRELARRRIIDRLQMFRGEVFREGAIPSPPEEMTAEEIKNREKLISRILRALEPQIAEVAVDLIKNGVQDGLQTLDTGTLKALSETSGDLRIRRRVGRRGGDPLVLEYGDGIKQPIRDLPIFL